MIRSPYIYLRAKNHNKILVTMKSIVEFRIKFVLTNRLNSVET